MAIIKHNQPVKFDESVDLCSTDTTYYTQIVDNTDVTQFQLGLDVCNGQAQLLPDPNFSSASNFNLGANWTISNNTICHTTGFGSGFSTTYNFPSASSYYQVTVVVDSISNGAIFDVALGGQLVGSFSTVGTHVFYGFPIAYFGITPLSIAPNSITDEVCISAIGAYEILVNFKVVVYDADGVFIDLFEQSSAPNYFTFSQDTVTITVDWANFSDDPIANGCYYFCLLDPCLNTNGQNYPPQITNGEFTGSATGWTLASAWAYSANAVNATFSATPANNLLTQSNVFVNYTSTYSVTIIVTAHTGNALVYFGTALAGTLTGTGTFVITGIPVGDLDLQVAISAGTITIASILATDIPASDFVCDYQSNTFKLGDYSCDCPETLLINAINNEDGLGFVFEGSGFSPRVRLQGKLKQAKYSNERTLEEDSLGTKRVIYYNRRKEKKLVADLLPEYIHDFLSTLMGYDHFYINGVEYVVEDDEYNVTYDDSQDNVGGVSLLVSEKTQLIRNTNCTSIEQTYNITQLNCVNVLPQENIILLEDGTNLLLEDGTNLLLEI